MKTLLTYRDVAARLAVSTMTVRRLVEDGKLRPIVVGERAVRFSEDELARYVSEQTAQAPAQAAN